MLLNALALALREIRRNVMRSFLTVLGIVIGVAAVIVMVTLGEGATESIRAQIASMGTNLLVLRPGQAMGMGQGITAPPLKLEDAEAIERDVGSVIAAAPLASQAITAIYGNQNWSTSVTGADNRFFVVRNWPVVSGREFNDTELRGGRAVCVLGATVVKQLFGSLDPVGTDVRLKQIACTVVGVLQGKGQSSMGMDQDDLVVMPLRAFQRRIAGNQDIRMIQIAVREGASTERARRDIELIMRERRHLATLEDNDFMVHDLKELTRTLTATTQVLTALLGAVAAVSLLVGGIGIMNIMLVSVTERTREIGIRLAIGALEHEVLTQFLVEAVTLASLGGVIGIALALLASIGLAGVLQVPFVFNAGVVVLAFLFSAAVGVIFGYFPARKAARLDPIEALRHE